MSRFTNLLIDAHNDATIADWERAWLALLARYNTLFDGVWTSPLGETLDTDEPDELGADYDAWLEAQNEEHEARCDAGMIGREVA